MKGNRGITLAALVITLIVLLVLTSVVVKSIIDMDIIKLTANATKQWGQEEEREKNELDRANDIARGHLGEIEGAVKFGKLEWNSKKASVTITKTTDKDYKIEYKVIDKNGKTVREYQEIESGGTVRELNLGDFVIVRLKESTEAGELYTKNTATLEVTDLGEPVITINKTGVTSKTLKVTVSAIDNEAGMPDTPIYKYYIKKSTDTNYPSEPSYTGANTSYEFANLVHNTEYDIKVETVDIAGNTGSNELKSQKTVQVTDGGNGQTGAITFGSLSWSSYKASVVITKTTTDNYKMVYKVVNSSGQTTVSEREITSGSTISGLNLGDQVIARLTDGSNYGNTATLTVTETGKPTVTATKGAVTGTSVAITVGASDDEAGMPDTPTYKVYVKKTTDASYPNSPSKTSTSTSILVDGLSSSYNYDIKVTVEDKAGNEGENELKGVVLNTPPIFVGTQSGTATSNTTITITATAKDSEQTEANALTYTLNYGTSTNYEKTKTVKGTSGSQVTFNLTSTDGISNYTTYYWRVDVTDGIVTTSTTGTPGSTKTKCGLGTYCSGPQKGVKCSKCNGTGEYGAVCGAPTTTGFVYYSGHWSTHGTCDWCGKTDVDVGHWEEGTTRCNKEHAYQAGHRVRNVCRDCRAFSPGYFDEYGTCTRLQDCPNCKGKGRVDQTVCSAHSQSTAHYYCSSHSKSSSGQYHD